jgi:hypothetical protein
MNGYKSLHTSLIYNNARRVEVQIKTREMHHRNEYGLAAHWAYKQGGTPDGEVGWLRDLVEILDASHDAEELLENTKMAIYQDRIFAFTPKGALFQMPKGATPSTLPLPSIPIWARRRWGPRSMAAMSPCAPRWAMAMWSRSSRAAIPSRNSRGWALP